MIKKIIEKVATKVLSILIKKIETLIQADLDGDNKIG
jgi:hypothetical protein